MTEIALVSGVSFVISWVSWVHVLLGTTRLCSKPGRQSYMMDKLSDCCAPAQLKEQSQDAKAVRDKQNRLLQRRLEKRDVEVGILTPYLALVLFSEELSSQASLSHAPSCSPQTRSLLFLPMALHSSKVVEVRGVSTQIFHLRSVWRAMLISHPDMDRAGT